MADEMVTITVSCEDLQTTLCGLRDLADITERNMSDYAEHIKDDMREIVQTNRRLADMLEQKMMEASHVGR